MSELTWWFSPHPAWEPGENWPAEVPVVRFETDDEVVLIDPFLPPDDDFDPHGKPVRVLLTQPCALPRHRRFRRALWRVGLGAASGRVAAARQRAQRRPRCPRGVEAIELDGEPQQVLFFIPEHGTLVSGDVLSGTGGALHVFVDEADASHC